ncbi:MAG: acyl-CoA dehydrogenase family protein [Janthinobacterium lividum]
MNFEWTDEQRQLRDSVERVLNDQYTFEARRALAASEAGWSRQVWQQLSELGLTALLVPEAYGGLGGCAMDLLQVMEAFGKAMLLEPYLASAVLGVTALVGSDDEALKESLLPQAASGETLLAFAHDESAGRHAPLWVETKATRQGDGWVLSGGKINVLHGHVADQLIVTARVAGAPGARDGLGVFLVAADAAGLQRRGYRLLDQSPAAELRFAATPARALLADASGAKAIQLIDATVAIGTAAICAEAIGAMQASHALTLTYLNTRQQFGRLIGTNQALRHRAVEMLVSIEICRSMAIAAAASIDHADALEAPADLIRAKLLIGKHGRTVCQQAVQLHGGIGMTEEYAVGHYLRRLTVIDQLFGDSDAQSSRLAALLAQ